MKSVDIVLLGSLTFVVWAGTNACAQTPAGDQPTSSTAASALSPEQSKPAPGQSVSSQATAAQAIHPQDLARQIYNAAYRVSYFAGTIAPANWKMRDASRKSLEDTLASLRSQLKILEDHRYKFSGQPTNVALGKDVASSIAALRPNLDLLVGAVAKYWGSSAAVPFKQAADQLLDLEPPLEQYLASLSGPASKSSASLPGAGPPQPPAPQTNATPAASTTPPSGPPSGTSASMPSAPTQTGGQTLTPTQAQVHPQDLARQIYNAAYRVSYFVGTVAPANRKMRDASRKSLEDTLASLHGQLKILEDHRYKFSGQPTNVALGKDVASSIAALRPNLDLLAGAVAKYWGSSAAVPFKQAADQLLDLEPPLEQYLASLSGPASRPSAPLAKAIPAAPENTAPAASTTPPTGPPPETSAPAPSAPVRAQLSPQDLARQIYDAAYRVNDLLRTLTPGDWKMDDASRKSLDDTFASLRSELKTLEERRYKFSGQPSNVALGKDLASGIGALRPDLDVVAGAVAKYQGSAASPFEQAEEQLLGLSQPLDQYLASLESPAPASVLSSGTAGEGRSTSNLETETITATSAPPPSAALLVSGAVTPQQMKDVTHEIYVATYRIRDLLSVLNPAAWKADDTVRASFQAEEERLRGALKALDDSSATLAQETGSLPNAFATYKGIPPVISGVNRVADTLAQYQDADAVTQFRQPAAWLTKSQDTLEGYFEQMLKRQWRSVQDYETGLASCQKTLNYAMYGRTAAATPMTNIMPVLKGRHVRPANHKAGRTAATKTASAMAESANKGAQTTRHLRRRHGSKNKITNGK